MKNKLILNYWISWASTGNYFIKYSDISIDLNMLATVYIRFQHLPDSKARYFRGRRLSLRLQEQRALRGKMSFSSPELRWLHVFQSNGDILLAFTIKVQHIQGLIQQTDELYRFVCRIMAPGSDFSWEEAGLDNNDESVLSLCRFFLNFESILITNFISHSFFRRVSTLALNRTR